MPTDPTKREQFEAYCLEREIDIHDLRHDGDRYVSDGIQALWVQWYAEHGGEQ